MPRKPNPETTAYSARHKKYRHPELRKTPSELAQVASKIHRALEREALPRMHFAEVIDRSGRLATIGSTSPTRLELYIQRIKKFCY